MRHVFPTNEIPHKWAHQTQDDARNPQGNLYFRGATIYSYRDSWPLARIYGDTRKSSIQGTPCLNTTTRDAMRDAGVLVLSNSERYSVTTAAHQSAVNYAVSHMPRINVPYVDIDNKWCGRKERNHRHTKNLDYLAAEIAQHAKKAGRVMRESSVQWHADRAAELHKNLADYLIYFRIRRKCPPMPSFAAAFERARRIENPDPVRDARKLKERARRLARETAASFIAVNCARSAWRLGSSMPYVPYRRRQQNSLSAAVPIMLRVNGAEIETSQGARIPVDHAPRIWRLVQAVISSGRPYERNGHTEHAGSYAIDRVDVDGTLHAGCHTIPHSELRSMARQLGLMERGQS